MTKTQSTKKTLSAEITRIKSELSSLNLKIKSTSTQIDQLSLEVEKLNLESKNTTEELAFKKTVLAQNLINLYQKNNDGEDVVLLFLKNEDLSDAMLEVENMIYFGKSIKDDLNELRELKDLLNEQKEQTEAKVGQLESTKVVLDNRKTIAANIQSEKTEILTKTKSQEKNYQTLLSTIEEKRNSIEGEIDQLEEVLKAEIDPGALPVSNNGVLLWPVTGTITQKFGATSDAVYLYKKGVYKNPSHNGIDIAASIGTTIYAAEAGEVVAVGNQDKYCYRAAYGKYIVIKHNNNLTTLYGHLSLQNVKVGDIVKRGDIIGYVGNTGYSTGPHLHFTVYYSPTFKMNSSSSCGSTPIGAPVNPLNYL